MKAAWLDTNVLLRFLTKEPRDLAERARRLMRRAEAGSVELRVAVVVVQEVVYVLEHHYDYPRRRIAETLAGLLTVPGLRFEDAETVSQALVLFAERNVDFVDAYIAASAGRTGELVASFDRDFTRLGVELLPA